MVNSLTREAGARIGPLLLETLVKHYFDRLVRDNALLNGGTTKLRKDELLYDEAFSIVKVWSASIISRVVSDISQVFLEAASK